MPDRTLSQLLADDHAQLTHKLEQRPLTNAVMARLARRARRKWIVLGAAAIAGATLAASQISSLELEPLHLAVLGPNGPSATMLAGAALIAVTTAVLGWSLGQE